MASPSAVKLDEIDPDSSPNVQGNEPSQGNDTEVRMLRDEDERLYKHWKISGDAIRANDGIWLALCSSIVGLEPEQFRAGKMPEWTQNGYRSPALIFLALQLFSYSQILPIWTSFDYCEYCINESCEEDKYFFDSMNKLAEDPYSTRVDPVQLFIITYALSWHTPDTSDAPALYDAFLVRSVPPKHVIIHEKYPLYPQSLDDSQFLTQMPANDLGRDRTPQWPEFGVPSEVKNLINRFYGLVDTESEEAFSEGIAQFTADGFTEINERIVQGHSELLRERRASWDRIAARKHVTYRVYVTDAACLDLLVIGRNDVECRNGERFSQEYAQNFVLSSNDQTGLLIRKFQAWVDFSSLQKTLSRPSKRKEG